MKLKSMLISTAAVAVLAGGNAFGQTTAELTLDQVRIETNDCPFGACLKLGDMSETEAVATITALIAAREAALAEGPGASGSANGNGNGNGNGNNGRGNALGQQDNSPQVVYLEFNPGEPTFEVTIGGAPFAGGVFPDYIYTELSLIHI